MSTYSRAIKNSRIFPVFSSEDLFKGMGADEKECVTHVSKDAKIDTGAPFEFQWGQDGDLDVEFDVLVVEDLQHYYKFKV